MNEEAYVKHIVVIIVLAVITFICYFLNTPKNLILSLLYSLEICFIFSLILILANSEIE